MPSMRPHPLNPRAPAAAAPQSTQSPPATVLRAEPSAPAKAVAAPVAPPALAADGEEPQAAGDGGFHESSYELQHGLQISESEWPDDVTVPAALGER